MSYEITYTKDGYNGLEIVKEIVPGGFLDAHYRAHSLTNCSYVVKEIKEQKEIAPRSGHQVTKANRQYVAISYGLPSPYGKPVYDLLTVGTQGESKDVVRQRAMIQICADMSAGETRRAYINHLFVVSLSVARRSYKRAWKAWEAAQEHKEAAPRTGHQVTKANRQYVALSHDGWLKSHKTWIQVVLVGKQGEPKEVVLMDAKYCLHYDGKQAWNGNQRATLEDNLFVVSLSVARRSYKRAWKAWTNGQ